jgi:serine/threonine protein kinase
LGRRRLEAVREVRLLREPVGIELRHRGRAEQQAQAKIAAAVRETQPARQARAPVEMSFKNPAPAQLTASMRQISTGNWRRVEWREKSPGQPNQNKVLAKSAVRMGKGAFGTVMKATAVCGPDHPVALKILKKSPQESAPQFFSMVKGEVEAMKVFTGDSHFVQVVPDEHGKGPQTNTEYAFMMNLAHGDVAKLFVEGCAGTAHAIDSTACKARPRGSPLKRMFEKVFLAVYELVNGFDHLHKKDMIHRDVKPANMMVRCLRDPAICYPVLGDLGLTCAKTRNSANAKVDACQRMLAGTPLYMAPEFYRTQGTPEKSNDMWSVGLIAYEMVFGKITNPLRAAMSLPDLQRAAGQCQHQMTAQGCKMNAQTFNSQFDFGASSFRAGDEATKTLQKVIERLTDVSPSTRWTAEKAKAAMQPFLPKVQEHLGAPVDGMPLPALLPPCWSANGEFKPSNNTGAAKARPIAKNLQETIPAGHAVDEGEVIFHIEVGPPPKHIKAEIFFEVAAGRQSFTAEQIKNECLRRRAPECVVDEQLKTGKWVITKVFGEGQEYTPQQLRANPAFMRVLARGKKGTARNDGIFTMGIVAKRTVRG